MSEEHAPSTHLAVLELSPELIAELEAHGGKDLVKRWERLIRAMEDLKHNPIGPNKSVPEWLAEMRGIMEAMMELRERDEDDRQALQGIIDALRHLEIRADPQKLVEYALERLVQRFQDGDMPLDPKAIEDSKAFFAKMSEAEKQSTLYLRHLISTDDAFGIVIRGHVLIENALDECVSSYVPHAVDLSDALEIFFAQKLLLAKMLGIISADEYNILKAFNKLRNEIAHNRKRKGPGFQLTPQRERDIWNSFVSNPAMSGKWPKHDQAKHPIYLRYMVVHLYQALTKRANELKERRLSPVVDDIQANDPHARIQWAFAPLLVHIMMKIPDFQP